MRTMSNGQYQLAPDRRRVAWIVDDSPLEREMARRALAGTFDVEVFEDGSVSLEQLTARAPPDVLVADWVMPGVSGIDICQFVRSRPATATLGILLLTTNQTVEQVVQGLNAGANDYLAKPYAPEELRARVAALIRAQAMRERAEHAEQLLRRVLSHLPDAVVTFDHVGSIVFVNKAAERIFGRQAASLLGLDIASLEPGLTSAVLLAAQEAGRPPDVEIRGRMLAPFVSIPPNDDLGNTTVTLRDVTDLRQRDRRQVDFYSMVAHDLRSPLTALQMRAQMLLQGLRGPLSAEVKIELEKMGARVRDLVRLVSDFLDVAQMESAHFKIEHGSVDLGEICAAVYDEYLPLAAARALDLELESLAGASVQGDGRRLTQVIDNLVSNALKFTPGGGRVWLRLRAADPGTVEVSVEDTGNGIPAEVQSRLFTKYARGSGAIASKVEGTGLGLLIVKEIVEAHGGTVGVRSEPGHGSTFWLRLPAAAQAA
jgi:signal transduction histidine kinase